MKYSSLTEIYSKLDKTTKRLEKTHILSEFLKKVKTNDLKDAILLLQGKVFPDWDERKVGIADRLLLKAINTASGKSIEKLEENWKKTGDLGDTAENSISGKTQGTLFSEELTIKKVIENLQKLSELEGKGTVERKVQLVAELLTSAKGEEAKYIAR